MGSRGFTLIETLMVIVLMGIIGSGLLVYFAGLGSSGQGASVQATALAEAKIEEIMAAAKANGFNTIASEAAAALSAPFDRFQRSVEVYCVEEADLDASSGTMPSCNDSDIRAKRVKVTLSWPGGAADFVTVVTNH